MESKQLLRYEVTPRAVEPGKHWVTATLENVSPERLKGLEAQVNSLDTYSIELRNETRFIPVPMMAKLSGSIYLTVDGERDGKSFHWESPDLKVRVSEEAAKLMSLLAASEPEQGVIRCEVKLRGRVQSEGLRLERWVDKPRGVSEELASIATSLSVLARKPAMWLIRR